MSKVEFASSVTLDDGKGFKFFGSMFWKVLIMSVRHYATKAAREVVKSGKVWTKDEIRKEFALGSSADSSVAKCFSDWSGVFNHAHSEGVTYTLAAGKPKREGVKLTESQRQLMGRFVTALDGLAELFGGTKEKVGRGGKPFDMLGELFDDDADDDADE